MYVCMYVPDEGSLLPKYRDCTTSNDFELYIYIYILQTNGIECSFANQKKVPLRLFCVRIVS